MQKSTRILALILLALMLVGMVPFSLFAEEGETTTTTPEDTTTGKTYAEQLAAYVSAQGGILYHAQDYDNAEIVKNEKGEL